MHQPPRQLDLAEVARLEEARLAHALAEIGTDVRFVGSPGVDGNNGVAVRTEPGSWLNQTANLGMRGPVDPGEIEAIAGWYAERGIEPKIEHCPYAHHSVIRACAALGFVASPGGPTLDNVEGGSIGAFEMVLYRDLVAMRAEGERFGRDVVGDLLALHPPPEGITIAPIDPWNDAMLREFIRVCFTGFLPPGGEPTPSDSESVVRSSRSPKVVSLAAWDDSDTPRMVGVGACEISGPGEACAIFGATTLEPYRRRGIQQAMLAARLAMALERGAAIATIGSRPGMPTERNVRRMGFNVAYTKVILVKKGQGLRGSNW
jgi:GNAT superfamily N-acetyltransferase